MIQIFRRIDQPDQTIFFEGKHVQRIFVIGGSKRDCFAQVFLSEVPCITDKGIGCIRHIACKQVQLIDIIQQSMEIPYCFTAVSAFHGKQNIRRPGSSGCFYAFGACNNGNVFFFQPQRGNQFVVIEIVPEHIIVTGLHKVVFTHFETAEESDPQGDNGHNGKPAAQTSAYFPQCGLMHYVFHLCTTYHSICSIGILCWFSSTEETEPFFTWMMRSAIGVIA